MITDIPEEASAEELTKLAEDVKLTVFEWINILRVYTAEARLRILLPLLALRNPGRKYRHRDLAILISASREKTTRALGVLAKKGEYDGQLTTRWGRRV